MVSVFNTEMQNGWISMHSYIFKKINMDSDNVSAAKES